MADFAPIGVIRSLFRDAPGTPIQPVFAEGTEGTVEVLPQCTEGLRDLNGFDRIWLLYSLHKASPGPLRVIPFRDTDERGVFATRAPSRPNAAGFIDHLARRVSPFVKGHPCLAAWSKRWYRPSQ